MFGVGEEIHGPIYSSGDPQCDAIGVGFTDVRQEDP